MRAGRGTGAPLPFYYPARGRRQRPARREQSRSAPTEGTDPPCLPLRAPSGREISLRVTWWGDAGDLPSALRQRGADLSARGGIVGRCQEW